MKKSPLALESLSRRERQIMEIVYARRRICAEDVQGELPDGPSYSAVRAALSSLSKKGWLKHERQGPRYYFWPAVPPDASRISALKRLLETFFNNSAESVVATMLDHREMSLSEKELDRLQEMIRLAKKRWTL